MNDYEGEKNLSINIDKKKLLESLGLRMLVLHPFYFTAHGNSHYDVATDRWIIEMSPTTNSVLKSHGMLMTPLYGTFEQKIKLAGPVVNNWLYPAFWEHWTGGNASGILGEVLDGTYYFTTNLYGPYTRTTLTGQDWTVERTEKMVWAAGSAILYIDGVQIANHTTNIPNHIMFPLAEVRMMSVAPTTDGKIWVEGKLFDGRNIL